ncbi:kinase [Bacillus phage vB_BcoS-136]|uniref:ABC1 atypical kinase-like domain-containing protein n=1 Tax=Bacillus phage vB_BcoS-136 TaxID=2419619 RepID=A0A3G3BVC7_9CAUD|nr:kinase [Bacillus phage vB_BcoS-136]AYP68193.1 hypothetical protein vBBcoS136_00061 [Bacillus phage vB_BcoS-136]
METVAVNIAEKIEVIGNISQDDLDFIIEAYENDDFISKFDTIGSGTYGRVFGYKDYAMKRFKDKNNARNVDIEVLKDLQHLDCIPKIYATINDEVIIMERIHGVTVKDYCERDKTMGVEIDKTFLDLWDEALISVIKSGYSPDDLHESNVMIDIKTVTPKFVDVGYFFKHGKDDSYTDIHTMRRDYGYSRAEMWTGTAIKAHLRRKGINY